MKSDHLESKVFSITSFAEFSRTTRDTLLYYDKIGLLSPISRQKNNYRLYSTTQMGIMNLIRTCQALGMPLSEIKDLVKHRTPEKLIGLHESLIRQIDEQLDTWVRSKKLLMLLHNTIISALNIDETSINVRFMPAEAIILGGLNDYSGERSDYDTLVTFYKTQREKDPTLDLNYPVWAMFSQSSVRNREFVRPDRYYFYNPDGFDRKPASLYAIGYARCGYGQNTDLYDRMTAYIDENGYEICGPAYEEYPLNEISVLEEKDYLMRVSITVREKQS